jgi:hypothetical protein
LIRKTPGGTVEQRCLAGRVEKAGFHPVALTQQAKHFLPHVGVATLPVQERFTMVSRF